MEALLVLIPAFNAESTIGELIQRIHIHLSNGPQKYDILVVDDGSEDRTSSIASAMEVQIIRHMNNLGKGAALKSGFGYALTHSFEYIATIDADLQHDPASLLPMVEYLKDECRDLVIGARTFDPKKMSVGRRWSNRITSALIGIRADQPILDSQSGYRILRTDAIQDLLLKTSRYETESELLIRLCAKGKKIGFYPIDTIYQGETSHIRHVQDTLRFIRMYFSTLTD